LLFLSKLVIHLAVGKSLVLTRFAREPTLFSA